MAKTLSHGHLLEQEEEEEEDYIDIDMSSGNGFLCYAIVPPPLSNEFEFQMSTKPAETEAATSPADELFYKGKLLPLHLPPRLQMVEKLLGEKGDAAPPARCSTSGPQSIADESCKCSAALVRSSHRRSSWSKKLDSKLKASKAYLKSLFARRRRSSAPCAEEKAAEDRALDDDANALALTRSVSREKQTEEEALCRRKSFSGAINWSLAAKNSSASLSSASSSSSSSFSGTSSNRFNQPSLLNRSSSFNVEAESSIQGAIAHCKKSQKLLISGRKSTSDVLHLHYKWL
ncbi:hypothetical protein Cni_G25043 [Canna indica]|uniref:Membrane-associated kinase regulator 4 n=1 Tax=Canna indica TaxID=4628 RepID=A0AAQ3L174_9LILI|nr:hypothetical protein Cni_G25043 [Canna indica]